MKKNPLIWLSFAAFLVGCVSFTTAGELAYMTADELKGFINDSNVIILDVRSRSDWTNSEEKIVGAVRADPKDLSTWPMDTFKDKSLVLYCA